MTTKENKKTPTNIHEYYQQLYTHTNNLPKAPQNEHIQKRKTINKKTPYTTNKNGITYTTHLPTYQITRGHCPECNCKTYSYDKHHGEKVCPQCGLVLEDTLPQTDKHTNTNNTPLHTPYHGYTYEEKKYLRTHQHHKPPYTANKTHWWNKHTTQLIHTLTSQAQLNKTQKIQTQYIIDTIGFKKLHSRANRQTIITAVIRYILKQTYTTTQSLRYNTGIYKNNLDKETYDLIEQNIQKHMTQQLHKPLNITHT